MGLVVEVNKSINSKSDKNNDRNDDDNKCDPSYLGTCISPPPPNLNCGDPKVPYNLKVKSPDSHGLDHDKDGIECESNNTNINNNNDDDNDNKNPNYVKKIIKYQGSKCTTQSGSIPLAGKITPKTPILIDDFYPCKLNDGRATLNLPNTPNLQFALIHLDRTDGNHEAVVVNPQKIQNVGQNNALFVVEFDDQFQRQDSITGQSKTIKDVNAIALYNKARQTLDFEDGNGLGITAVLQS